MKKNITLLIFAFLLASFAAPAIAADTFQVSGYYKTLVTSGQSFATKEGISAATNRLRLELKTQKDPWQFYLTVDNEAIINDFANTADFAFIRSRAQNKNAALDMDVISVDNDHLYLKHSVYRAFVKYYTPEFQAVVGKQLVDWGRLRFYSPIDIFNSVAALNLEPDERIGIDAINVNFSPEDFVGINIVAAPDTSDENASGGIRVYKTVSTYDVSLIAASVYKNQAYGFSFDGYLKNAGFRGEVTHNLQDDKREFTRAALGVDYRFNKKWYALAEHFYNGGHEDNDPTAMATSYKLSRQIVSLNSQLSSFWVQYTLSPLIEINQYAIYDWDGPSVVLNPEVQYDLNKHTDLRFGTQLYFGKGNSEFGDNEHLYYGECVLFF